MPVNENIPSLHIPMDIPVSVEVVQGLQHLLRYSGDDGLLKTLRASQVSSKDFQRQ